MLRVPVGWCYLRKMIGLGICPEHRSFDRVPHYGSSESIPGVQPFAIELYREFEQISCWAEFSSKIDEIIENFALSKPLMEAFLMPTACPLAQQSLVSVSQTLLRRFWTPWASGDNGHTGHKEAAKCWNFGDKTRFFCGTAVFPTPKVPVGWCYSRKMIGLGICPEHRSFDRVLHYGSSESIPGVQPFAIELLRDFSVFQVDLYIRRNFSPKCEKSWKFLIFHVVFAHPEVTQGDDKLSRSAKGITEHF